MPAHSKKLGSPKIIEHYKPLFKKPDEPIAPELPLEVNWLKERKYTNRNID